MLNIYDRASWGAACPRTRGMKLLPCKELSAVCRPFVAAGARLYAETREAHGSMPLEDKPDTDATPLAAGEKTRQAARQANNQATMGLELPFVLVGTIALGAAFGYYLDRWMHTKPIFMLVLGALGFAGGIREILRRLPGGADGAKPS